MPLVIKALWDEHTHTHTDVQTNAISRNYWPVAAHTWFKILALANTRTLTSPLIYMLLNSHFVMYIFRI